MSYSKPNPTLKTLRSLFVSSVIAGILVACVGNDDAEGDPDKQATIDKNNYAELLQGIDAGISINTDKLVFEMSSDSHLAGDCGGTLTANEDITLPNISANYIFENYCSGDLTKLGYDVNIHGKINAMGTYHPDPAISTDIVLETASLDIPNVNIITRVDIPPVETFVVDLSGTFDIDFAAKGDSTVGVATNHATRINSNINFTYNNDTHRLVNYTISKSNAGFYDLNGRYYHPTHGYLDFTTTSPFTLEAVAGVAGDDYKLCNGTASFTGENAVMDYIVDSACTHYEVCITNHGATSAYFCTGQLPL